MKTLMVLIFIFVAVVCSYVHAYEVITVNAGGSVSGKVLFNGKVPRPIVFPINKNPDVCGPEKRVLQEVMVNAGGLSNVVVYISDIEKGKPFDLPENGYKLIQQNCRYVPHLQVVKQKSRMTIISKDSVAHNIHTFEIGKDFIRTVFNQMQPDSNLVITEKVRLRRSKVMKVECDLHSFMHAWIFVADNPYFTIAAEDGMFRIDDIPPGQYMVNAWNPGLGEIDREIAVTANSNSDLVLVFSGIKE